MRPRLATRPRHLDTASSVLWPGSRSVRPVQVPCRLPNGRNRLQGAKHSKEAQGTRGEPGVRRDDGLIVPQDPITGYDELPRGLCDLSGQVTLAKFPRSV